MKRVFRLLARLKGLRGTRWDIFARTEERRAERALIRQYEQDIGELLDSLSFLRHKQAVAIARIPETIRGFGHVKARNMAAAEEQRQALLAQWRSPERAATVANAA